MPSHHPWMPETGRRADPDAMRTGVLLMFPTSYNTQESRPCTSPGQHNRANPVGRNMGEVALNL